MRSLPLAQCLTKTGEPRPGQAVGLLQGTIVVLLAHELGETTADAFRHLKRTAGAGKTVRLLLDAKSGGNLPDDLRADVLSFDSRDFAFWGLPTMGPTLVPGHAHFPLLALFVSNPQIEWLWHIEYDVRFTGRWSRLFNYFREDPAGYLTCHLRTHDQEPLWGWWDSLKVPAGTRLCASDLRRAFMIIGRYSADALRAIIAGHKAGWSGHHEVVVPTMLAHLGIAVRDLGERPQIQFPFGAGGFYSSLSDSSGSLVDKGTVCCLPARARAGWIPNTLYHPVKPVGLGAPPMLRHKLLSRWKTARGALGDFLWPKTPRRLAGPAKDGEELER